MGVNDIRFSKKSNDVLTEYISYKVHMEDRLHQHAYAQKRSDISY